MKSFLFISLLLCVAFFAAHSQANTKLSNLVAPTAVNADLLPGVTNTRNLGSATLAWKDLYLRGYVYLDGTRFISNHPGTPALNTFIGFNSGISINGGINNTAVGHNALNKTTSGSENTAVGSHALFNNTTGNLNTAYGSQSLYSNTTGAVNIASGTRALFSNTTGNYNSAYGYQSLYSNTSGTVNIASGAFALFSNTTGNLNTAYGSQSLYRNTSGTVNIASGYRSLFSNTTGNYNSAYGSQSLYSNTTGSYNTAYGTYALNNNISGYYNAAYGNYALNKNISGGANIAIGYAALANTTTAWYNTAVGFSAGDGYNHGYNNVFVGYNTDVNGTGYYNVIAIGQSTICTAPSQVTMGNPATTSYRAYAGWSNISDGRFKKNVKDNVPGLVFINKLRPITYHLDATGLDQFLNSSRSKENQLSNDAQAVMDKALKEKEALIHTGFVAQEVEKAAKELGFNFSGVEAAKNEKDVYALKYSDFVVPLVKAVQELDTENKELAEENRGLKDDNATIKQELAELRQMVLELKQAAGSSGSNLSAAYLEQSTPNPTQGTALIRYYVPQNCRTANLVFTDMKGAILKSISISTKGAGQLSVNTAAWTAGTYTYTLYTNGTQADSKKLVIAR
jgi:trimeric autotransporter adhesin